MHSVSLVSLDYNGLELIFFNVFLCLEAISFFLILPDVDIGILN